MNRTFYSLLVFIALSIAIVGMACIDPGTDLDRAEETDGAT